MRDPVSRQSRGFGFVTYVDEAVARKLINEISITEINGRKVDLRNAEPKTQDKAPMSGGRGRKDGHQSSSQD